MKILIIGNGFDLAHYLPTAYAHFMGVMQAIERLPDGQEEIAFDDLFADLEQSNTFFFGRTREIYDGGNLKFDVDKIYELKGKLQENTWYRFFKKHMEINTWIDFEDRIKRVLILTETFLKKFLNIKETYGHCSFSVVSYLKNDDKTIFIDQDDLETLTVFGLLEKIDGTSKFKISDWYTKKSTVGGYASWIYFDRFYGFLQKELEVFSKIFESYLGFIVGRVSEKASFESDVIFRRFGWYKGWKKLSEHDKDFCFDKIYSFNYTSTIEKIYKINNVGWSLGSKFNFLHGKIGDGGKKIVLGIDGIDEDLLYDYKLYGFIKYHQKLLNDTDYLFLSHDREVAKIAEGSGGKLEIYIWGHSMDASDSDYVKEIFDLDERFIFVKIFYFGNAKFDLLANLLKIVGREKIERWMKKGLLRFEQAPDLYELNFSKQTFEPEW